MNQFRGEHSFVLDGETYTCKLSVNSLCTLETVTGEEATVTMSSFAAGIDRKKVNFTALRAILWASLLVNHEGKTLQSVGDMIEKMSIPVAADAVLKIIQAAFPKTEGEKAEGSPQ